MEAGCAIGVDLGGTKILAGLVDRGGRIVRTVERPTPTASAEAVVEAISEVVEALRGEEVQAVGCGAPVRVDRKSGVALAAVNVLLPDVPLERVLAERIGLPVAVINDGSAAALAEYTLGAGRGASDLVLLTLGTGVGGGFVLDGKLYRGWSEAGHMVIVQDGYPCQGACTGRGHVESYCSGTAADRLAREVLGAGASARDLVAQRHPALATIGRHLGAAVATLQNLFDPDVVVIGGGFGVSAAPLLFEHVRAVIARETLAPAGSTLRLAVAELGANAGLIGAGLVAFDALS